MSVSRFSRQTLRGHPIGIPIILCLILDPFLAFTPHPHLMRAWEMPNGLISSDSKIRTNERRGVIRPLTLLFERPQVDSQSS